MSEDTTEKGISRRNFLRVSGMAALGAQAVTLPFVAHRAGADKETWTGWESNQAENTQFFKRKSFEISMDDLYTKYHPREPGPRPRPDKYAEMAFNRVMQIGGIVYMKAAQTGLIEAPPQGQMGPMGLPVIPKKELNEKNLKALKAVVYENLPDDYFRDHYDYWEKERGEDRLLEDMRTILVRQPQQERDKKKYATYLALNRAYFDGYSDPGTYPEEPDAPPEISDYTLITKSPLGVQKTDIRRVVPATGSSERLEFKSPEHASELIKKVTHEYGATIVGITTMNPDFAYVRSCRGGAPGSKPPEPAEDGPPKRPMGPPKPGTFTLFPGDMKEYEVPSHWKYVIVFGIPHDWEQLMGAPHYADSVDAYTRLRIIAGQLTTYLKKLGFAARHQVPGYNYDIIVTPFAVQAGLGQWGRHGCVISPEIGANMRLAAVITELELAPDNPVDLHIPEFCNDCVICAEKCPTNAISFAKSPKGMVNRGYEHWAINTSACYGMWGTAIGTGCRLCIACCPYSRKDNWVHGIARAVDPVDPTGLVNNGLIWMQKTFFHSPAQQEYLASPDGCYASYKPTADWLTAARYLKNPHENPKDLCES